MSNVGAWRDDVTNDSGVRLALRVAGPSDAPPVVLLHGWAQSAEVWTHQLLGPLSESYRWSPSTCAATAIGRARRLRLADAWAADLSAVLAHVGGPRCWSAGPTAAW